MLRPLVRGHVKWLLIVVGVAFLGGASRIWGPGILCGQVTGRGRERRMRDTAVCVSHVSLFNVCLPGGDGVSRVI